MHEYDTVLKILLQGSANSILEQITGIRVARWLNVELPEVQQTRVDLLSESADEKCDLIHLELQSTNDPQLRKLGKSVRTKVQAMPIMHDILDHEVIGPAIKKGLQEGRQQGLQEGRQQEGISMLRRLIEKRFGPLPASAEEHLTPLSIAELEDLSLRVLDAKSMDELFGR
jgi:predicted transposase YdaD